MSVEVLSGVSERRLRPIYELLDTGNYKKAFHEADKVLKKQKDLLAAKVLKTIALHRMGKEEEAFALSCEVVAQDPVDENSLQGLSLYYKECHKTELISPMYEQAVKLCPQNEEYLTHLFMSYVRQEKFQEMRRVAMLLYKQHPKNPYLFWGIMAIVLLAQNADEKLAQTMYLPLAEKMVEKHIEKGKIEAEAEVRLYLLVLELLGKHEKAMEVLNGNLGKRLTGEVTGYTPLAIEIEKKLLKWDVVNAKFKELLKKTPDVWNYSIGYLDSFFRLLDEKWTPPEEEEETSKLENGSSCKADYKLEQAYDFIAELVKTENDLFDLKRRGPFLMRLEMLKRLRERRKAGKDVEEPPVSASQLLLEYALDFSTKPCCVNDLKPYFQLLPANEIDQYLEDLYKQQATFTFDDVTKDFPAKLKPEINKRKQKEFYRHIFTIEATRFLGRHRELSKDDKLARVDRLLARNLDGMCFCDDNPATDTCVVDLYCTNAVRLLIDLYEESGDLEWLWRCLVVLEEGMKSSVYNFEIKLLMIRIYCKLGVFSPCAELYDSMEIKHMQQDTLGYLVCRHVTALGHFHLASQVFQTARSFYLTNNKESVECLISCFRNGTFYKVTEFVEYRRCIQNSFHSALTRTEHVLMDIFTQGGIDQPVTSLLSMVDLKKIDYEKLIDNRDFSVIADVNEESKQLQASEINESFTEEKSWLRFRELLLHNLHALLTVKPTMQVNGDAVNNDNDTSAHFQSLLNDFEQFCSKLSRPTTHFHFYGPHPTRLRLSFDALYPQTMLQLFRVCNTLLSNREDEVKDTAGLAEDLTQVLCNLQGLLTSCEDGVFRRASSSSFDSGEAQLDNPMLCQKIPKCLYKLQPSAVERMVLFTEMFSICVLMITNLRSVINEVKANLQRKRRRKKGKPAPNTDSQPQWIKECQSAVEKMKGMAEKFVALLNTMKSEAEAIIHEANASISCEDTTDSDEEPSEDTIAVRQIVRKIVQSVSDSLVVSSKQMLNVAEGRLKNLKEMKF